MNAETAEVEFVAAETAAVVQSVVAEPDALHAACSERILVEVYALLHLIAVAGRFELAKSFPLRSRVDWSMLARLLGRQSAAYLLYAGWC